VVLSILNEFKEKFDHEVVKQMRDFKVPGMSFLITKDGKTIYERAFGLREKVNVRPTTVDTLYGVSSITKSLTCMAILQLQEARKLDINDPISKHIPVEIGFKDKPILIHHLMSHSSGIPSTHDFVFSQMNQQLYTANVPDFPLGNWDDFYFHVNDAKSEVIFKPESKYYYWNGGFALLSQIVAKASGISFEDYVKDNILIPLEMNRSTFFREEAEKDEDVTKGFNYAFVDKKIKREPKNLLSGSFIAGSGGLISSVREITKYLQCFLNNGKYKKNTLLSDKLIKEMCKTHNTKPQRDSFNYYPGVKDTYGYGFHVLNNYHGYTVITHSGVSGVTGGQVAIVPELKLTFAQLYNVSWLPSLLMHTALVLLFGKNHKEEIPYYKRKKHYKTLCGRYESYKKITTVEIKEKNGLLYLHDKNWSGEFINPLIPKNNDAEVLDFYIVADDGVLNVPFTMHKNGNLTLEIDRYILHKKTHEAFEE
jgi:CubicO group peptidase (beta-lactamase class C family)